MKFTIFLSSDGKHTVQGEAEGVNELFEVSTKAQDLYDALRAKYGTKQEQTVKAYTPKPSFPDDTGTVATPPTQTSYGVCPKCGAVNLLSARGKTYCSKRCWLNES